MPSIAHLVRHFLRTSLRGRTRLTIALARHATALQRAAVQIIGARPLFLDLRDPSNHDLFRDAPYSKAPWEWSTAAAFQQLIRPGDVAFDIGANRGLHAVVIASLVGQGGYVACFEPNPSLRAALAITVGATPWMELFPVALSDRDGEAPLFVGANHEMGSLGNWVAARTGETTQAITVPLRQLDSLVREGILSRPDIMKVDVEGNELRVFRGAHELLDREDAPIIIYEENLYAAPNATGESASAATAFLLALSLPRYRCYYLWEWGLVTRTAPGQILHGNLVAIPKSRRSRWPELESSEYTELRGGATS
jgi:FkbM family methyltransferase